LKYTLIKMKNKSYRTVRTIIKVVERGKLDTTNTQTHDRSLTWLGIGTLIKMWRGKTNVMFQNLAS
jgi:hypothetical protein